MQVRNVRRMCKTLNVNAMHATDEARGDKLAVRGKIGKKHTVRARNTLQRYLPNVAQGLDGCRTIERGHSFRDWPTFLDCIHDDTALLASDDN